jgi:hypothetical protein
VRQLRILGDDISDTLQAPMPIEWKRAPPLSPSSASGIAQAAGSDTPTSSSRLMRGSGMSSTTSLASDHRSVSKVLTSLSITSEPPALHQAQPPSPLAQLVHAKSLSELPSWDFNNHSASQPLLFPDLRERSTLTRTHSAFTHFCREGVLQIDIDACEGDQGKAQPPRSLEKRLLQAEQGLAEKDLRIEALEACTARLAERLALAEGLGAGKERHREPSTPSSIGCTSISTYWTGSDIASALLARDYTVESLGSGSVASGKTPDSPTSGYSSVLSKRLEHKSSRSLLKKRCQPKTSNDFASAADIDAVCRRSEQLLKAMTATVASNERIFASRHAREERQEQQEQLRSSQSSSRALTSPRYSQRFSWEEIRREVSLQSVSSARQPSKS